LKKPKSDPDESLEIARKFLEILKPVVDSVSVLPWTTRDGFWTVVVRAVLRRQFDWLEGSIELVKSRRSDMSIALLRPACEEFLWIKYLRTLSKEDREVVILAKNDVEAYRSLKAQLDDSGQDVMRKIGFPDDFLEGYKVANDEAEKKLKGIGARLGWNLRKNQVVPSLALIARTVNEKGLYDLIYHATSRTVHFSVSELFRRAWGSPEKLTISSKYMNGYWKTFTLYWTVRIFFFTFVEIGAEFEEQGVALRGIDGRRFLPLMRRFTKRGMVPIITPREMNLHLKDPSKAFRF